MADIQQNPTMKTKQNIPLNPIMKHSKTDSCLTRHCRLSPLISRNSLIITDPLEDIPICDRLQSAVILGEINKTKGDESKLQRISSYVNKSAIDDSVALSHLEEYAEFNRKRKAAHILSSSTSDLNLVSRTKIFNPFLETPRERKSIFDVPSKKEEEIPEKKEPFNIKYERGYKITRKRKSIFDVPNYSEEIYDDDYYEEDVEEKSSVKSEKSTEYKSQSSPRRSIFDVSSDNIEADAIAAADALPGKSDDDDENIFYKSKKWIKRRDSLAAKALENENKKKVMKAKKEKEEKEKNEPIVKKKKRTTPKKKIPSYLEYYSKTNELMKKELNKSKNK